MRIMRKNPTAQRRFRKTVTFTGAAGAGAVGTVTVATITGRVYIDTITAYCTVDLTEAAPTATVAVGVASDTDAFFAANNATDIDAGEWIPQATTPSPGAITIPGTAVSGATTAQQSKAVSENIIITVGAQNVTAGAIVFDAWYFPLTDTGGLA